MNDLLGCVCEIAKKCGAFLLEEQGKLKASDVQVKGAHDFVTYVDKEAEKRLIAELKELPIDAGFITEEGLGACCGEEYTWVIDPLDGTTNYIHNTSLYCVSIGLAKKGVPVMGVVYEVRGDELYSAYTGGGAYLNGKRLTVSANDDLSTAMIGIGLPYNSTEYNPRATSLMQYLYGRAGGVRILGSAAAELCLLAAGRFDGRIESSLGAWDIAAGSVILREAGGRITNYAGEDILLDAREVVSSNGHIHRQLLHIINNEINY